MTQMTQTQPGGIQWTAEHTERLQRYLSTHELQPGIGTHEATCNMGAINIALSGTVTDSTPNCMSEVIGTWITYIHDYIPDAVRNSPAWHTLLARAAQSGRNHEPALMDMLVDWTWRTVLPRLNAVADDTCYGAAWREMCESGDPALATSLGAEILAVGRYLASDWPMAEAASSAAFTKTAGIADIRTAAISAAWAAAVASAIADDTDAPALWNLIDPRGLLSRLCAVSDSGEAVPTAHDDVHAVCAEWPCGDCAETSFDAG